MTVNATLINLYNVCPRECWLHANGIHMEHNSDTVADGKLLHETSYADRNAKHSELFVEANYNQIKLYGKIDFYDAKQKVIYETKRGNKVETAHSWQVKFYLWLLLLNGIEAATGIIEYPLLRQKESIELTKEDVSILKKLIVKVSDLQHSETCPPVIKSKICRSCSYFDLCYINEL